MLVFWRKLSRTHSQKLIFRKSFLYVLLKINDSVIVSQGGTSPLKMELLARVIPSEKLEMAQLSPEGPDPPSNL